MEEPFRIKVEYGKTGGYAVTIWDQTGVFVVPVSASWCKDAGLVADTISQFVNQWAYGEDD